MTEKSVEQKIKESKQLIIQNMEKTIQHKMIFMYLKDRRKEGEVKQYSVNARDGIIKMEFHQHQKALQFYDQANFIEKILIRPFNIYFNLTLSEAEMKKYYLQGITEQNQRKLFEAARKLGFCKLYTSYGAGPRAKLKSTGLLSFIRKEKISQTEFNELTEQLKVIGIKISSYNIQEKGTKVSLILSDFISQEYYQKDDSFLQDLAENKAKEIVESFIGKVNVAHLSVIVKKKQIIDPKTQQRKPPKLSTSALFEFDSSEECYQHYEKVRVGILNRPNTKVKLFFHNEENNSYLSLITQGLSKPQQKTEKQFEEQLIQSFRQINPNILQVNIFPVSYNSTYIGRVYLKNEEEGKNFLVDYSTHRSKIFQHYKENIITFNISIDIKTLKKIKMAQQKAKQTEDKIKKQGETTRRDNRRPQNQYPLPPMGMNAMLGSLNQGPMMMLPPMGGLGGIAPMGPLGDKGMMGLPPGMPAFGRPPGDIPPHFAKQPMPMGLGPNMGPANIKIKLAALLRDKQRFVQMEENNAKRGMMDTLRLYVEDLGVANGQQAVRITNSIVKERNVSSIFTLLQNPDQFKQLATSIKNNQH